MMLCLARGPVCALSDLGQQEAMFVHTSSATQGEKAGPKVEVAPSENVRLSLWRLVSQSTVLLAVHNFIGNLRACIRNSSCVWSLSPALPVLWVLVAELARQLSDNVGH